MKGIFFGMKRIRRSSQQGLSELHFHALKRQQAAWLSERVSTPTYSICSGCKSHPHGWPSSASPERSWSRESEHFRRAHSLMSSEKRSCHRAQRYGAVVLYCRETSLSQNSFRDNFSTKPDHRRGEDDDDSTAADQRLMTTAPSATRPANRYIRLHLLSSPIVWLTSGRCGLANRIPPPHTGGSTADVSPVLQLIRLQYTIARLVNNVHCLFPTYSRFRYYSVVSNKASHFRLFGSGWGKSIPE